MAFKTNIEWCDSTWNPWIGCQAVSPGCDHCYAEDMMDTRFGRVKWGPHGERQRTSKANWAKPHAWQRQAKTFFAEHGRRQRVFCASLADVFDNKAPDKWREDLWKLIDATPDLDWLLLTKRPENIIWMLPGHELGLDNIWLGTTVEDQIRADHRIPHLLKAASALGIATTFLSCEPLLGPVDIEAVPITVAPGFFGSPFRWHHRGLCHERDGLRYPTISWVISGGESGPKARPSHPDWHRSLRDQCARFGVPFLFKQWGEWSPRPPADQMIDDAGIVLQSNQILVPGRPNGGRLLMTKVGKHAAGRMLDGIEHSEWPQPNLTRVA